MSRQAGFSLTELLVASTVLLVVILGALAVLHQAQMLTENTDSQSRIQGNVRLGADLLEHDLRLIGHGVPQGQLVGGSTVWQSIFSANATSIGFSGEIDGGAAQVTCTPDSSNSNCPRNRVRVDRIGYFVDYNCKKPDDSLSNMPLVVVSDYDTWQSATCSSYDAGNSYLTTSNLSSGAFAAGTSQVYTIEQVFYRYITGSQPPYGRLERFVRYANTPSTTAPTNGWTTVADHLTDFDLQYLDASGAVISTGTLTAAQRASVRRVVLFLEGFDTVGARGGSQLIQVESEVLVRNLHLL